MCPEFSTWSVRVFAPYSNPIFAILIPFSVKISAKASAIPHVSWVSTIVPEIGNPSATTGHGSISTCHLLVPTEFLDEGGCEVTTSGTGSGAAGAATCVLPPVIF